MCGVFALILWGIAYWVWWFAYKWFSWVTEPMQLFTLLALPVPFWAYQTMFSPERRAARQAAPEAGAAGLKPGRLPGLGWLYWLGNGELHRGTLVLLVVFFWSLFFWNWPPVVAMVNGGSLVFIFSFWGLLTIFGMVIIRSLFSRLPGPEVPGAGDSKSKPK